MISAEITKRIIDTEPAKWSEYLETVDYPREYMITFAAITATIFSLLLPNQLNVEFITFLANNLIPAEDAKFMTE